MKAAFINRPGAPDSIKVGELPMPEPKESEVLVKVNHVVVNPIDTYIRGGKYKTMLPLPFIIGRDMVGSVVKTGSSSKFQEGDRVWANNQGYAGRQGTFAKYIAVREDLLYHLPESVRELEAIAVFHSALTAVTGLIGRARIEKDESIFINGGSGNVGTAVIQIAKHLGARVATTAGNPEKAEWCKEAGADLVIDYKNELVNEKLTRFAPKGVNVYWDATKEPEPERALPVMARRGRMLIMSGLAHRAVLPIGDLYTKNCTFYGFTVSDLSPEELADSAKQINKFLQEGILKAKIHDIWPLARAAEAHKLLETTDIFGKLLMTTD